MIKRNLLSALAIVGIDGARDVSLAVAVFAVAVVLIVLACGPWDRAKPK